MNLQFKSNGSYYETTFKATGDFNIHLERDLGGHIIILQKTAGNNFAPVKTMEGEDLDFDYDFCGYVYPKDIQIKSATKVNLGIITFNE